MAFLLVRLDPVGWPDPVKIKPDTSNSWKLFVLRDLDSNSHSTIRDDIAGLAPKDKEKCRETLVTFARKAQTGLEICDLYDDTQCHEALTVRVEVGKEYKDVKVWRVRGADIRVYFCYLPNRVIALIKVNAKRTQKISAGEKLELKEMVQILFTASFENTDVKTIEQ